MKARDHHKPFQSQPLRNDAPDPRFQRKISFRMRTAMADEPRIKKTRIEHYPAVPFSGMAQMKDVPADEYPNLFSYISGRMGAHPSVSDAVALVVLNQFISTHVDFDLGSGGYTRPQRLYSREQLDEFMRSMRVFEAYFSDDYPRSDPDYGRTGSFRIKTVVLSAPHRDLFEDAASRYLDLYERVAKPPQGSDMVFLSYKKRFIPDLESLGDECSTRIVRGKHKDELTTLLSEFDEASLDLPTVDRTLRVLMGDQDATAPASVTLFALATGAGGMIPSAIIATIRKIAELCATIESKADSMLKSLPVDPKGLIETVAKHVGSKGALIVSGDSCDAPPDSFRQIRSFHDGVVLYQKQE